MLLLIIICFIIFPLIIAQPPVIVNITVTNPSCTGFSDGSLIPFITGGVGNLTVIWTPGAFQVGNDIVNAPFGFYSIDVEDELYQSDSDGRLLLNPPLLVADAGTDLLECNNNPLLLGGSPTGIGGTGNYTFNWLPITDLNDATIANPTATLPAGTSRNYSLSLTDANGCIASDTIMVSSSFLSLDPGFQIIDSSGPGADDGQINNIIVTGGIGILSYTWRLGPTVASTAINPTNLAPGSYTLEVSDQSGCSSTTFGIFDLFEIVPVPTPTVTPSPSPLPSTLTQTTDLVLIGSEPSATQDTIVVRIIIEEDTPDIIIEAAIFDEDTVFDNDDVIDTIKVISGPLEEVQPNGRVVKAVDFDDLIWVNTLEKFADFILLTSFVRLVDDDFEIADSASLDNSNTRLIFRQYFFTNDTEFQQSGLDLNFKAGDIKLAVEIRNWPFADDDNILRLRLDYETDFDLDPERDTCESEPDSGQEVNLKDSNKGDNFKEARLVAKSKIDLEIGLATIALLDNQVSDVNIDVQSDGQVILEFNSFSNRLEYDPSLSLLLGSNNRDNCAGSDDIIQYILPGVMSGLALLLVIVILLLYICNKTFRYFVAGEEVKRVEQLRHIRKMDFGEGSDTEVEVYLNDVHV